MRAPYDMHLCDYEHTSPQCIEQEFARWLLLQQARQEEVTQRDRVVAWEAWCSAWQLKLTMQGSN